MPRKRSLILMQFFILPLHEMICQSSGLMVHVYAAETVQGPHISLSFPKSMVPHIIVSDHTKVLHVHGHIVDS